MGGRLRETLPMLMLGIPIIVGVLYFTKWLQRSQCPSDVFLAGTIEPFAQGDTSATRRHSGTGLGLNIARAICQKMGGDIDFRSTLGSGSSTAYNRDTTRSILPSMGMTCRPNAIDAMAAAV